MFVESDDLRSKRKDCNNMFFVDMLSLGNSNNGLAKCKLFTLDNN